MVTTNGASFQFNNGDTVDEAYHSTHSNAAYKAGCHAVIAEKHRRCHSGQRRRRTHREIHRTSDNDKGNTNGHQAIDGILVQDVQKIVNGTETWRNDRADQDHSQQYEEHGELPLAENHFPFSQRRLIKFARHAITHFSDIESLQPIHL